MTDEQRPHEQHPEPEIEVIENAIDLKGLVIRYLLPGAAVLVIIFYGLSTMLGPAPAEPEKQSVDNKGPAAGTLEAVVAKQAAIKRRAFIEHGEKVLEAIDAFELEIRLWNEHVVSLLTNDDGRRLADEQTVPDFLFLFEKDRPSSRDAAYLRSSVQAVLDPIRAVGDDKTNTWAPDNSDEKNLNELRAAAQKHAAAYRDDREVIETMLRVSMNEPAERTLEDAIAGHREKERERELELITEERKRTQEALDEELKKQATHKQELALRDARCRQLADDPGVHELFSYAISPGPRKSPWSWHQRLIADGYYDSKTFYRWVLVDMSRIYGKDRARAEYLRRYDAAPERFDKSLWELFRILVQYRRDFFLTDKEITRLHAAERAKGRRANRLLLHRLGNYPSNRSLPPENTPPAPTD